MKCLGISQPRLMTPEGKPVPNFDRRMEEKCWTCGRFGCVKVANLRARQQLGGINMLCICGIISESISPSICDYQSNAPRKKLRDGGIAIK